jgi:hypothetical protein
MLLFRTEIPVFDHASKYYMKILLGDFNAKEETEDNITVC